MKNTLTVFLLSCILISFCSAQNKEYPVSISDIRLSDPFVFGDISDSTYYLYGSGGGGVVYCRASKDLKNWTERFEVYRFPSTHWAGENASNWASEVHKYKGKYYLFTTSDDGKTVGKNVRGDEYPTRATQIYVADSPRGPFKDFTHNKAHTPLDWPCLDGTLWIEDGVPYMVFCHEWLQILDGTMDAVQLADDLGVPAVPSFLLFKGSDAPYIGGRPEPLTNYVTDGPFLFKTKTGKLGMIWSSWKDEKYVLMAAYSNSGKLKGPWMQDEELLFGDNGGHGMLFKSFDGKRMLSIHYVAPGDDERPHRKPMFLEVDLSGDRLEIKEDGLIIK